MQLFEAYLEEYLSKLPQLGPLTEAAVYALLSGGRRFRPCCTLLVARGLGLEKAALPGALAVELFHTASLIADDLPAMDDELFRRGQATTHHKFGEAVAILTTYALIAEGYALLAKGPKAALPLLLEETTRCTGFLGATGGQMLDLQLPNHSQGALKEMVLKKTGALFQLAFLYGWVFGGGDLQKIERVKAMAAKFGMAFQLVDDLFDQEEDKRSNTVHRLGTSLVKEKASSYLEAFFQEVQYLGLSCHLFKSELFFLDRRFFEFVRD